MATTFINGKFTAQQRTGVQRYAHELVLALDALIVSKGEAGDFVLVCPPLAQAQALRVIRVQVSRGPRLPLHLWEQLVLPLTARGEHRFFCCDFFVFREEDQCTTPAWTFGK